MQSFAPSEPCTPCDTPPRPRFTTPISESSHLKKRRRPPPPLSVTSVFTPHRLPTNSGEFWQWPVTSWYLGEVGEDDVVLAKERPFVDHVALAARHATKPLPTHYRLRWLEEDAKIIVGRQPSECVATPEGFSPLPYADKRESDACARPMLGVKRPLEEDNAGRKKKNRPSRGLSRKVNAQTSPTQTGTKNPVAAAPSVLLNGDSHARLSLKIPAPSTPHQGVRTSCMSTQQRSNGKLCVEQNVAFVYTSTNSSPANVTCVANKTQQNPVIRQPSPAMTCPAEAIRYNNVGEADSALQSCAVFRTDVIMKPAPKSEVALEEEAVVSSGSAINEKFSSPSRKIQLQFLAPIESRLMGSLTYSIPIPKSGREGDEKLKGGDSKYAPQANVFGVESGAYVDGMELHFRKTDANFTAAFDDSLVADELRSEISRQSTTLLALEDQARPLRATLLDALQTEFDNQREYAELLAEEKNIAARLKEMQQQKKAAKVTEKGVTKEVTNANRRTSERRRPAPRNRARSEESKYQDSRTPRSRSRRVLRPSRKLLEDMDDDDDDDNDVDEQQQPMVLASKEGSSQLKGPSFKRNPLSAFEPVDSVSTPVDNLSAEVVNPSSGTISSAPRTSPQRTIETATSHSEFDSPRDPGPCTAPSPSDDGTAIGIAQSPCGIFPGESEENSKPTRVPSPVSPLQATTPRNQYESFPKMKMALKVPETHFLKAGLPLRAGSVGDSDGMIDH